MTRSSYDNSYYKDITTGSKASAAEVLPLVFSLYKPGSVVDVGCGTGSWLNVCESLGISEVMGMDGSYVPRDQLQISPEKFTAVDLESRLHPERQYDLVISLEVAEHIRPEKADVYIENLCRLGDLVLFSAAIPGQGGVNHFNEQYPAYWEQLFRLQGFTAFDIIRDKIWMNEKIDYCYRQNILLFVRDTSSHQYPVITREPRPILPLVHPSLFEERVFEMKAYKYYLRSPFHSFWYLLKSFFRLFKRKT